MIKACTYPFFKNIAYYMLKDKYPADFRIADFKPYQHPDIQATINKTGTYSLLDYLCESGRNIDCHGR